MINDTEIIQRTEAMRLALILSATDPVVVHEVGDIFYDCCEDEEEGEAIVKKRIKDVEQDIRKHYRYHESMAEFFDIIQAAENTNDREGFACAVEKMIGESREYSRLVDKHKAAQRHDAFLNYPYTNHGHFVDINGEMTQLQFNVHKEYHGFRDELRQLELIIPDFRINQALPKIKRYTGLGTGEGYDDSLRGRLNMNRQLLARVGFYL